MSYTAAECAAAAEELAAIRAMRLAYMTGGAVRSITTTGGKKIEYQPAKLGDWDREIARLQSIVDSCAGVSSGRRVINFIPLTR